MGHPSFVGCPATNQGDTQTGRQRENSDFGSVEAEQQGGSWKRKKKELKVTYTHKILWHTPSSGMQLIVGVAFN